MKHIIARKDKVSSVAVALWYLHCFNRAHICGYVNSLVTLTSVTLPHQHAPNSTSPCSWGKITTHSGLCPFVRLLRLQMQSVIYNITFVGHNGCAEPGRWQGFHKWWGGTQTESLPGCIGIYTHKYVCRANKQIRSNLTFNFVCLSVLITSLQVAVQRLCTGSY